MESKFGVSGTHSSEHIQIPAGHGLQFDSLKTCVNCAIDPFQQNIDGCLPTKVSAHIHFIISAAQQSVQRRFCHFRKQCPVSDLNGCVGKGVSFDHGHGFVDLRCIFKIFMQHQAQEIHLLHSRHQRHIPGNR